MAIRQTTAALLLALSPAPYANWSVTSNTPIHVAHTDRDALHWIAVTASENDDCSTFQFQEAVRIIDREAFIKPGQSISPIDTILWVDGKAAQHFTKAALVATPIRDGEQSVFMSTHLTVDAAIALSTGRIAELQHEGVDPSEFDLTGSKAAITQAVISCYNAIGRDTTIYPQPHVIIP